MKFINIFKSPNYNKRNTSIIKFIIIHYTALENFKKAVSHLCNPNNRVSCHYLISQDGNVYNLVNEDKRAWHAGEARWSKYRDINSLSIGIELDYSNYKSNNKFSNKMISSLKLLINLLMEKYNIKKTNVLGHSDIAPYRKIDPGINFPWSELSSSNLAKEVKINDYLKIKTLKKWFKYHNIKSDKKISLFILSYIGYDVLKLKKNKKLFSKLIMSYQSRFINNNVNGKLDSKTLNILLNHYLNFFC